VKLGHSHGHDDVHKQLTFAEKAQKLVAHWMKHNDDHAAEYRRWAAMFRQNAMDAAADALEVAAQQNEHINTTLHLAKEELDHLD
jgi:hypothetical protein